MRVHFRLGKRNLYPWLFLAIAGAANAVGYILAPGAKALDLYLPITAAVAGFVHFLYSQHNHETQLFVSLFDRFNVRYDSLNNKLNAIVTRPAVELTERETKTLFDYFNLCAEEYLFYKAGYLDQDVWRSWLAGMKHFAKNDAIRSLWEIELKSGSYYGFSLALIDAVPEPLCQSTRQPSTLSTPTQPSPIQQPRI